MPNNIKEIEQLCKDPKDAPLVAKSMAIMDLHKRILRLAQAGQISPEDSSDDDLIRVGSWIYALIISALTEFIRTRPELQELPDSLDLPQEAKPESFLLMNEKTANTVH